MRTVPDAERLKFCRNPTVGDRQFPAGEARSGDAFVDFVDVDVCDETWTDGTRGS